MNNVASAVGYTLTRGCTLCSTCASTNRFLRGATSPMSCSTARVWWRCRTRGSTARTQRPLIRVCVFSAFSPLFIIPVSCYVKIRLYLFPIFGVLEFYLILNVAVGSTNGWFPEDQGNKPWLDRAQSELPRL